MRIVSEGGRTWGVIENPLRDPPFHKTYVDLTPEDLEGLRQHELMHQMSAEILRRAAELHGRTCTCFPCEQSNERMDRDDPSVGGYDPTN